MYDTVKVKPVVMCPDELSCPLNCSCPQPPRRIKRPKCPKCPSPGRRRHRRKKGCHLVPIGAMSPQMGGMMGMGMGMGMGMPSSPQMGFGGGRPVSLMPDGRKCITFPYGNNLITNLQGMQGMPLPGHMIYNNNCFQ